MTDQNDVRRMLADTAERLFRERVDAKTLERAQREGWAPELWQALEQAELPLVGVPADAGGAGGTLGDAAALLRIAGRYAAPVPLAETGVLAGWLLAAAGLPVPGGPLAAGPQPGDAPLAIARSGAGWRLTGRVRRMPWARVARRLVVLASDGTREFVAGVDRAAGRVRPGHNLAREPRDEVAFDGVALATDEVAPAPPGVGRKALALRGALCRALLMAGALERALDLAVEHARVRVQFGRKIGQFQAIQQELARFGGEVAAAVAAALSAAGALERGAGSQLAVAAAKVRCAEAAREGALIAHQVHGAIGVTEEHALHYYTTRLWAWREEYGNEAHWALALGRGVLERGADALWPTLTEEGGRRNET